MKMTTNINEIVIAAPVKTFDSEGLRTVKITTVRNAPADVQFYAELHDERGVFRKVLGSAFDTAHPLKSWNNDEGASILIEGRGAMRFINHAMGGPKYPITRIVNDKTGNVRNVRVTFKVAGNKPASKMEAMIFKHPEPEIETMEPELVVENEQPQMTKPVKSDYESFGDFMKACKQFKQWQREQAELVTA